MTPKDLEGTAFEVGILPHRSNGIENYFHASQGKLVARTTTMYRPLLKDSDIDGRIPGTKQMVDPIFDTPNTAIPEMLLKNKILKTIV